MLWEPTLCYIGRWKPQTDYIEVLKRDTSAQNTSELAALMDTVIEISVGATLGPTDW